MGSTSCRDCRRPVSVHARLGASRVPILLLFLVSLCARSSHALLRSERRLTDQAQPAAAVTRVSSPSSDFVAIYYNLFHKQSRQSTLLLPPVVFKQQVPTEIQTRLRTHSLRFHELPELLKRVLLWESGYSLRDNASLAQIHTLCGLSMAEIALSETQFSASSDRRYAKTCKPDQLLLATKCATTAVDRVSSKALWSSKALDSSNASETIPNIQMRWQQWQDPEMSQLTHVYAIHTTECEDTDVCAPGPDSGVVIPCVPYQRSDTRWCRPKQNSLMTSWLEEYAQSVFLDSSHSGSIAGSGGAGAGRLELSDLNVSTSAKDDHGVYVIPAFQYDGTSSDFAQQFYRRSLVDSATAHDKLTIEQTLPREIEQRLSDAGLSFGDLPPLLQRALVWDAGYAFAREDGGSETLRAVHVKCGLAMSDIAMPRESVSNADCEVQTCALSLEGVGVNQSVSHRALSCTNDRIVRETQCAVASADALERSNRIAVWADGGVDSATPDVHIKKYSVESENASFVLLGIHTSRDDLDARTSSECVDEPSMIIPCVPYPSTEPPNSSEGEWCRPNPGALVTSWLRQVAKEKNVSLLYLVPILIAVALAVTGLAVYIRRTSFTRVDGKRDESRRNGTAVISTPDGTYASGRLSLSQRSSLAVGEARLSGFSSASVESFAAFSANSLLNTLVNHPSLRLSSLTYDQLQFRELVSEQGGRVEVWRGVYHDSNVAIKRPAKTGKTLYDDLEAFMGEITLNASLEHPNIAKFLGVSWNTLQNLCMVTEFVENGNLQIFLAQRSLQFAWEKDKMHIALGIANAVCYLHQQRSAVYHSDLKAKHVLLSPELDAKLIGCGARRRSRPEDDESAPQRVAPPFWTAPEVLQGLPHSEKADMYSLGVVLSELDTHQLPYEGVTSLRMGENLTPLEILEKVIANELRPTLSPFCPPEIADLIDACLAADPQQRPSASEALVVLVRVPIAVVGAKTYSF